MTCSWGDLKIESLAALFGRQRHAGIVGKFNHPDVKLANETFLSVSAFLVAVWGTLSAQFATRPFPHPVFASGLIVIVL